MYKCRFCKNDMVLINADLGNNQYNCTICKYNFNIKVVLYSNKIEEFWKFETKRHAVYIHRGTSSIYEIGKIGNSSYIGGLNCQLEPNTTDEDIGTYIAFQ